MLLASDEIFYAELFPNYGTYKASCKCLVMTALLHRSPGAKIRVVDTGLWVVRGQARCAIDHCLMSDGAADDKWTVFSIFLKCSKVAKSLLAMETTALCEVLRMYYPMAYRGTVSYIINTFQLGSPVPTRIVPVCYLR